MTDNDPMDAGYWDEFERGEAAPVNVLWDPEREARHKAEMHQSLLAEFARRAEDRARRHQEQLDAIFPRSTQTEEQMANVLDRLRRAGEQ